MSNIQLSLINLLSQYKISVNRIIYASKVDTYEAIDFQGLGINCLEKVIFDLLNDGICFIENNGVDITIKSIKFYKENNHFDFDRSDLIGLTKKGGELWEEKFLPNWNNYAQVYHEDNSCYEENPTCKIEVITLNKDILLAITKDTGIRVDNFITHKNIWHPFYWKEIQQDILVFSFTSSNFNERLMIERILRKSIEFDKLFLG